MGTLSAILELRRMLGEMERDLGLQELSGAERNVLLAALAVAGKRGNAITSDQIRQHDFASKLAQATYHRALKGLVALGHLERADGYKARHYILRSDLADE